MYSRLAPLLVLALLIALPGPIAGDTKPLAEMDLRLDVEPMLIGKDGEVHPLNEANESLVRIPGAHHRIVQLGTDPQHMLVFVLRYELVGKDTIAFRLERSIHRGRAKEKEFPETTHRMNILDSWHTTVLDDIGTGERLVLRVVPLIRPVVTDVPFDSKRLGMRFSGGPSILYGGKSEDDRVIHRGVNVDGTEGLSLGVEGLGVFRIAPRQFPGAVQAGWVRGNQWRVSVGGHDLGGWSNKQILPDDPSRPGAGWVLYATFEQPGPDDPDVSFYGGFQVESD